MIWRVETCGTEDTANLHTLIINTTKALLISTHTTGKESIRMKFTNYQNYMTMRHNNIICDQLSSETKTKTWAKTNYQAYISKFCDIPRDSFDTNGVFLSSARKGKTRSGRLLHHIHATSSVFSASLKILAKSYSRFVTTKRLIIFKIKHHQLHVRLCVWKNLWAILLAILTICGDCN